MMADAELAKAKRPKRFFTFFDHCKALRCNLNSVRNARCQACGSRTVPNGQICATGEFAYVGFGHAGIEERRQYAMIAGSPLARTPVALIVHVYTISHCGEPAPRGKLIKLCEKLVFTEKAAIRIVSAIGWIKISEVLMNS